MKLLMPLASGSCPKGLGWKGTGVLSLPAVFLEKDTQVCDPVLVSGHSKRNKATEISKGQWLYLSGRCGRHSARLLSTEPGVAFNLQKDPQKVPRWSPKDTEVRQVGGSLLGSHWALDCLYHLHSLHGGHACLSLETRASPLSHHDSVLLAHHCYISSLSNFCFSCLTLYT